MGSDVTLSVPRLLDSHALPTLHRVFEMLNLLSHGLHLT